MRNLLATAVIALALVACSKSESVKSDNLSIVEANGSKIEYKVELAQTEKEMSKGLMFRDSLGEKTGMLFALWKIGEPSGMWMKNTKIPLDMLFVDKDGMIYWIYENAEPNSVKLIVAPYAPYAVLEVNAGDVIKYGIKIGDTIKHSWFEEANKSTDEENKVEAVVDEMQPQVSEVEKEPATETPKVQNLD